MKKTISLLLMCILLFSSCGNESNYNSSVGSETPIPSSQPEVSSTIYPSQSGNSKEISENFTAGEKVEDQIYELYEGTTHTLNLKKSLEVNYTGELPSSWLPRHNYSPLSQNETYKKETNSQNIGNYSTLNIFINEGNDTISGKTGFPFFITENSAIYQSLEIDGLTIYHSSYSQVTDTGNSYYNVFSSYIERENISPVLVITENYTKETSLEPNTTLYEQDIYKIMTSISNVEFSEMSETTLAGDGDRHEIPAHYLYNKEYVDSLGMFISFRSGEKINFSEKLNTIISDFSINGQEYNLEIELIPIFSENLDEPIKKELKKNGFSKFILPTYQGEKMVLNFVSSEGHYYYFFVVALENINYIIKLNVSSSNPITDVIGLELDLEPIITTLKLTKE